MKETKILLTISLLVSNRIDTIRNCMESLRPLLEQLPCELIAVDTVGEENSDGSLAIVKEYATKIVHFDWCNDFAAARNAGLTAAAGEWFLSLDDDEWFENVTPLVEFFSSEEYLNYDRASYAVRNYTDMSGTKYEISYRFGVQRLFPESRYVGKIHEHIVPVGNREKALSVYAHHYGYVYKTEEDRRAHAERNIVLIKKELEENPTDLRMQVQLLLEYKASDDLEEEKKWCESIVSNYQGDVRDSLFQYALIDLIRVTRDIDREEGKKVLEWVEERFSLAPINVLYCGLEHMNISICENNWDQVIEYTPRYLSLQQQLSRKQYFFSEYNDIVSKEKEQLVVLEGIKAMLQAGRFEAAESLFDVVDWLNTNSKPFEQMELLLKVYAVTENGKLLFEHANKIIKNKKLIPVFQAMINTFVSQHPDKVDGMREHLAGEF